jgi:hypothetical protein
VQRWHLLQSCAINPFDGDFLSALAFWFERRSEIALGTLSNVARSANQTSQKLKIQMKCLFKIALTLSLSSITLVFIGSHKDNQLNAKTLDGKSLSSNIHQSFPSGRGVLALNINGAEKFGDDFLAAWKNGKSSDFIPNQLELDEFLYSIFGAEYKKLPEKDRSSIRFDLFDSLKALHTNPVLISGYKKTIFKKTGISKDGENYIYNFSSKFLESPIRNGAIRIKEINGKFRIVDTKDKYWLTSFTKEKYLASKGKVSMVNWMKLLGRSIQREWGPGSKSWSSQVRF